MRLVSLWVQGKPRLTRRRGVLGIMTSDYSAFRTQAFSGGTSCRLTYTIVLMLLVSIVSTSCIRVGPDYEKPDIAMPDAWSVEGVVDGEKDTVALQTWWTSFEDPVLDGLIDTAKKNNMDLKLAAARVLLARAQLGYARGALYPNLTGKGAFQSTRTSRAFSPTPSAPSLLESMQSLLNEGSTETVVMQILNTPKPSKPDVTTEFHQLGIESAWELDMWGRIRRSILSAKAGLESNVELYRDVLRLTLAEVASTYIEIRTVQQRLYLARENVKLQEETLKLTQNRYDAGLAPLLDVHQAESNLSRTRALIPSFLSQQEQAAHRLALLLGEMPNAALTDLLAPAPIPSPNSFADLGIPADTLRQRPDIRAAERALAAQTEQIGIATADLYPLFSLSGTITLEDNRVNSLFNRHNTAYNLGPGVSWNLFDAGRVRNAIKIEEARTEEALATYEKTVITAMQEVTSAMVAYAREVEKEQELARGIRAVQESVRQVGMLYKAGLTDFQNVLDMQRSLTDAQDSHATSQGQVVLNLIGLYRTLGGGWDFSDCAAVDSSVN